MERRMAAGQITVADDPVDADVIIGGRWPARVPGSQRYCCRDCGGYVSLSPLSGQKVFARFSGMTILCFPCAKKRMNDEEQASTLPPAA